MGGEGKEGRGGETRNEGRKKGGEGRRRGKKERGEKRRPHECGLATGLHSGNIVVMGKCHRKRCRNVWVRSWIMKQIHACMT